MPFPYLIILGRDTALPWTLSCLKGDGIVVSLPDYFG